MNRSFQNWHKEFNKIWPKHSKFSKIFILMGSYWSKYLLLDLKKYRGIFFHETEGIYKIWRGINLSLWNWHKESDKFSPERSKLRKTSILMGFYWAKYIFFELKKNIGETFDEAKRDKNFGEESTCSFAIGISNLTKFDSSTRKSQKFSF